MALDYGETMVAGWLERRMCRTDGNPSQRASNIARHFNEAKLHKSHGRRIDRDEVRKQGLSVEDLETNAELQDAVLTLHHLTTIGFEVSPAAKMILSSVPNQNWVKNYTVVQQARLPIGLAQPQVPAQNAPIKP